jgi:hypothetical protein
VPAGRRDLQGPLDRFLPLDLGEIEIVLRLGREKFSDVHPGRGNLDLALQEGTQALTFATPSRRPLEFLYISLSRKPTSEPLITLATPPKASRTAVLESYDLLKKGVLGGSYSKEIANLFGDVYQKSIASLVSVNRRAIC